MSQGKLRCCGSSLFLKSRFGVGYTLTMVKAHAKCTQEAVTEVVTVAEATSPSETEEQDQAPDADEEEVQGPQPLPCR